jgi:hypothetical protein
MVRAKRFGAPILMHDHNGSVVGVVAADELGAIGSVGSHDRRAGRHPFGGIAFGFKTFEEEVPRPIVGCDYWSFCRRHESIISVDPSRAPDAIG